MLCSGLMVLDHRYRSSFRAAFGIRPCASSPPVRILSLVFRARWPLAVGVARCTWTVTVSSRDRPKFLAVHGTAQKFWCSTCSRDRRDPTGKFPRVPAGGDSARVSVSPNAKRPRQRCRGADDARMPAVPLARRESVGGGLHD